MTKDENQQVQNNSDIRKYFAMIPHMADDDLDTYEYRLYGHYIRVGDCWESTRTTAKACGMAIGKVSSTRKELEKKGYIKITPEGEHSKGNGKTMLITIVDRWAENIARYSGVHTVNTDVHEVNTDVHTVNQRRSKRSKTKKESKPSLGKALNTTNNTSPHSEYAQVVESCYGWLFASGTKDSDALVAMLNGKAVSKTHGRAWYQSNFKDAPVTSDEFTAWFTWQLAQSSGDTKFMPRKAESIHASIERYRAYLESQSTQPAQDDAAPVSDDEQRRYAVLFGEDKS